jgi:glycosyltransferase involved in cell wall biosynthesis
MPWLSHAAEALQTRGALRAYYLPLALDETVDAWIGRLPDALGARLRRRLSGRQRPDALPADLVGRAATGAELASITAARLWLPMPVRRRLADRRDRRFDETVSRSLAPTDTAVLLSYGAARHTVARARALGAMALVEQAVHHYRFSTEILQEEIRRTPDYAGTMQFHQVPDRRRTLLDAENETADRLVTLSTFSKQTYVDAGIDADRVLVNQLGVDAARFASVRRREDRTFRVLFLGVLSQRKGLSYAVEGFAKAGLPDSELLLVGTPWRGRRPWRGHRGIVHVPWVSRAELGTIFSRTDVLVLPSLVEGFARAVLEAMASGVPVIVTPNTGAGDVVREGVDGYLVPIRALDEIAERLVQLQRAPDERARMGRAARDRAAEFTWERYGERALAACLREAEA